MRRQVPSFLKTAAIIRYVAISLIATGILDKNEGRIALGVGLLVPNRIEQVDKELDKANKAAPTVE